MASGSRGKSPMGAGASNDPCEYADWSHWAGGDEADEDINYPQESMHPPTEGASTTTKEDKRTNTSWIWEHMHKKQVSESKYELTCKYCNSKYQYTKGQGYGTFQRHLRSKHSSQLGIDTSQQQIPAGYAKTNTSAPLFRYDDKIYKQELAKFAAVEHLSFNFGEKFGFNNFIQTACTPQAKPVPRNTLKRQIMELYKNGKKDLKNYFINFNGRVHIGSDIWTDPWQTYSYMGITCHWIDDDWNIQKRVIAFRVFDGRHTANNIYKLISQVLNEYSLVEKIFSIGFDNAAANTASIFELEKLCKPNFGGTFFHIRCACHVLNLCVQDGLRTLAEFLNPIKIAIQYLWRHPQLMREWKNFCKQHGRRPKRFPKDIPTRWNSTYELLNQSFEYKDLLCAFISNNVPQIDLLPQHWDVCQKILDLLKVFNDATYTLSGVYYPTTHLFIVECVNIVATFEEYENDDQLGETINAMRMKWMAYYTHIPLIYLVAAFFDPRTKLDRIEEFLNTYYACLHLTVDINQIKEVVQNTIIELCNDFSSRYNLNNIGSSSQSSHVRNESESRISRGYRMLMSRQKRQRGITGIEEIDNYLDTNFEVNNFGKGTDFAILTWWKEYSSQYRILSLIARQIFATPCSTVAVEQAFSAGGNILDDRRSRLAPSSLEAQACVDDWTKAQYRQQEMDRNNEAEFFDDGDTTGTGTTTGTGSD